MRRTLADKLVALGRGFSSLTSVDKSLADKHLPTAVYHINDIVAERASGSWIYGTDGAKYLDFTCGIGVTSTGHSHPRVVKAIQDQASRVVFAQQNSVYTHTAQLGLVDRLKKVIPSALDSYFFTNSGSEAIENAIKVVRAKTGRLNIICFENSFHGRTLGAVALTTSKAVYRHKFGPLVPGILVAPYPYCLHCSYHKGEPRRAADGTFVDRTAHCCMSPLESLEMMLKQQSVPEDVAAIFIEPILGEGGFLVPPPGFLRSLRQLCDKHGILLVLDEVQSGVGRTGTWWAHQQFDDGDARPDLLIFAKGIASGMPIAGIAAAKSVFEGLPPGSLGGTYGANPVCCAAASATIDVIEEEGLVANAAARGLQLRAGLASLAKEFPFITDVRGRGLMQGVEFEQSKAGVSGKNPRGSYQVSKACFKHGMLLMTAGSREAVRFLPPLNVSAAEIDMGLGVVRKALQEVA